MGRHRATLTVVCCLNSSAPDIRKKHCHAFWMGEKAFIPHPIAIAVSVKARHKSFAGFQKKKHVLTLNGARFTVL